MRWFQTAMLTWVVTSLVTACAAYPPGHHDQEDALWARLDAAQEIDDPAAMDRALAAIAIEAAFHGHVELVEEALDDIEDETLRDRTAADCAQRLWKVGKHDEAIEVADDIDDPVLRDEILSGLATIE